MSRDRLVKSKMQKSGSVREKEKTTFLAGRIFSAVRHFSLLDMRRGRAEIHNKMI
jgi:hypothetical protein